MGVKKMNNLLVFLFPTKWSVTFLKWMPSFYFFKTRGSRQISQVAAIFVDILCTKMRKRTILMHARVQQRPLITQYVYESNNKLDNKSLWFEADLNFSFSSCYMHRYFHQYKNCHFWEKPALNCVLQTALAGPCRKYVQKTWALEQLVKKNKKKTHHTQGPDTLIKLG